MSKSITEKGRVSVPNIKRSIHYVKRSPMPTSLISPALQADSESPGKTSVSLVHVLNSTCTI